MALAFLHEAFFDSAIGMLYLVLAMLLTTSIVSFYDGSIKLGCCMGPIIVDSIVLLSYLSIFVIVLLAPECLMISFISWEV